MVDIKEKNEPKILMNIRIDKNLRNEFRIKTIRENTTMSEVLMDFIKKYLEQ